MGELRGVGRVKVEFKKEVEGSGVWIGVKVSDFILVCSFVCVQCQCAVPSSLLNVLQ